MIINKYLQVFTLAAAASILAVGCGQPATNGTNSNANTAPSTNSAAINANTAATNTTTTTSQTSATEGSPSAAYRAAYEARKNKDIAGLKKILSKDVLDFLTMIGKADPKKPKTLDDMLKEMCDQPQAATAEARNEKIDGNKATIEYHDENGKWQNMDFIKEDGAWKLTIDKADEGPESIDMNSNSSKKN